MISWISDHILYYTACTRVRKKETWQQQGKVDEAILLKMRHSLHCQGNMRLRYKVSLTQNEMSDIESLRKLCKSLGLWLI